MGSERYLARESEGDVDRGRFCTGSGVRGGGERDLAGRVKIDKDDVGGGRSSAESGDLARSVKIDIGGGGGFSKRVTLMYVGVKKN